MLNARPVKGRFRRLRWAANVALVGLLFAVPWIRIGGEPLVLLDIPARRFHVFGLVIFPQELYFLWLLVFGLGLALFFFTALFGRLWCGWACPQTVFTDVFAGIARRVEGWKGTRRPARVALWRRIALHGIWIVLSIAIGFHLVSYFHSPYDLIEQAFRHGRIYPTAAGFHGVVALLCYADFVFLRQNFCKYLCPYARFQSVLFDRHTLVVGYDAERGEPRGRHARRPRVEARVGSGDCVDCGLCVAVCPSEIDIRDGLQLECIACTQCIDACDGVMHKLKRPSGLIGYRSLAGAGESALPSLLRPRVLAYGALLTVVALGFAFLVGRRMPLDLHVAHNRSALAAPVADGRVGNAFTLHISNRDLEERSFRIRLEEAAGFELVGGANAVAVAPASTLETRVFVLGQTASLEPREIHFVLERVDRPTQRVVRSAHFLSGGSAGGR